jgi:hypothetical protein
MPEAGKDVLGLVSVFGLTTAIAELAGAANLGTALAFGQVAFAVAVLALILRR